MFCSQCGAEYRPEITTCPTCEVPLSSGESSKVGATLKFPRFIPTMIDLVGFIDENQARDARSRLKAGNISCELVIRDAAASGEAEGEGEGEAQGEAVGDEYWIRVPWQVKDKATDLLGLELVLSDDICPSCGAALAEDEDCSRCGPGNGA